jgi:hypothetical protein
MVRCRTLKIGCGLATIVLLGAVMMRPGFAEDAGSGAHGDGKASTSGESNAARGPSGENAGAGAAKPDAHAPRGEEGKAHDGPPAGNDTMKDANPSAPGGTEMGAIDTSIAPSRRLDKKSKIGEGKSAIESLATRNLHRRMLSVPRPPHPAVRNAIGVPIPQHSDLGRHDSVHPNSLAVPHSTPAGTAVVPGAPGSRLTKIEGGADRRVPNPNPVITPPAARSGAITGTGLTHHNSGPSQIGGPKAATAGINGTTIRPKQ